MKTGIAFMALGLLVANVSNAAEKSQNWYPDHPAKSKGTNVGKGYDWNHAHLRFENKLQTSVELVVYKKDKSGKIQEVMKPDAKGRETTQVDTFQLDPGHQIYFYLQNPVFENAIDSCVYRVEAFILDSSGKRTGEHWYADGDPRKKVWCKQHVKTKAFGFIKGKTEGYYGWKFEVRKREGSNDKEIADLGTISY